MVQFHLHSANFMYISECDGMILLCNWGKMADKGFGLGDTIGLSSIGIFSCSIKRASDLQEGMSSFWDAQIVGCRGVYSTIWGRQLYIS